MKAYLKLNLPIPIPLRLQMNFDGIRKQMKQDSPPPPPFSSLLEEQSLANVLKVVVHNDFGRPQKWTFDLPDL